MCMSWFTALMILLIALVSQFNILYSDPDCFQINPEECSHLTSCKCKQQFENSAFCCNVTSSEELENNFHCIGPNSITALHILQSNLSRLDAKIFNPFNKLITLSITNNTIAEIHGQFRTQDVTCFNLSSNSLLEVEPGVVMQLGKLAMFSMSNNNFAYLPKNFKFPRMDVSGNPRLHCKSLIALVREYQQNQQREDNVFINRDKTTCVPQSPNTAEFLSVLVPFSVIEDTKEIYLDCPVINDTIKCDCSVHSLEQGEVVGQFFYQAKVDCSSRQLTALPKTLPKNTKFLNISDNNITSLDGIGSKAYSTIQELYADNNGITSMKELEGSQFLYDFSVLSLKGNRIDNLQTYMLTNVVDRNQGKRIFLGNNQLVCDCKLAQHVTIWLLANKAHIPDNEEIFCSNFPNTKVIQLHHGTVCSTAADWTDYIHYIIALEIILFLLLIAKVSYDYYVFKSAGYLPWPASKMPKLPCDWCFET